MSDNETVVDEETIDEQEEKLSKEEVNRIVEERVSQVTKEWQSRFDKIRAEKEDVVKKSEEAEKTWQQKMEDNLSAVKNEVEGWKNQATAAELKAEAIRRVSSEGLDLDDDDWRLVNKLIDPKGDDPLGDVDIFIKRQKAILDKAKGEYIKANGRRVQESNTDVLGKSLADMTDAEIARLSDADFEKKFQAEKAKK